MSNQPQLPPEKPLFLSLPIPTILLSWLLCMRPVEIPVSSLLDSVDLLVAEEAVVEFMFESELFRGEVQGGVEGHCSGVTVARLRAGMGVEEMLRAIQGCRK